MQTRKPKLSIVVLSYNDLPRLKKCIESIKKQTLQDIELIIVDNGSERVVIDYIEQLDRIRLIKLPSNQGIVGFNIGLVNAKSEYIAMFDQDCILSKNWAYLAVKELSSEPKTTGVISTRRIEGDFEFLGKKKYTIAFGGSGCIFKKEIVDKRLLYNEKFFIYENEVELAIRLKNRGYNFIYYPDADYIHDKPERVSNISKNKFSHYFHYRNALWNIWMHYPLYLVPFDTSMKLLASLLKCIRYGNFLTFLKTTVNAFRGLPYCIQNREVAKEIPSTTSFDLLFGRNRLDYPPPWVRRGLKEGK